MMEVYDNNYIEENYGVDADNAVMIKVSQLEEGVEGDRDLWTSARDFVAKNDMSNAENYKKACQLFDMDSFCEYIAMEVYIGNNDWLWNNWAAWRARDTSDAKYQDGKWRFMCYDTEFSMDLYGNGNDYRFDILSSLANGDGHLGPMFKSLLKNKDFKYKFVLAMEDVMNIAFTPQYASAQLDRFHKQYANYINQHFDRFVFWQNLDGVAKNKENWKNWVKNRYNYMPQQMNNVLKLGTSSTNTVTISINDPKGGWVYINGLPIKFTSSKWSGHYFAGYKISIKAVAAKGYEFKGWSNGYDGTSAELALDPTGNFAMTANFVKKAE